MAEKKETAPPPAVATSFDVVGDDGRRILRSLPGPAAEAERARIEAVTDEKLRVVPASAFTLGPSLPDK